MDENQISKVIVDTAIEVHKTLGGPGLLESIYQEALCWEVAKRGLRVEREKVIPIIYKGNELGTPLRIDLLIEEKVIIECKATTNYNTIFESQTPTYLRITNLKLGIVINFGENWLRMAFIALPMALLKKITQKHIYKTLHLCVFALNVLF